MEERIGFGCLRAAGSEEDVAGFEIAMDYAASVGIGDGGGDFGEQLDGGEWRERTTPKSLGEVLALDERHGEVGLPRELPHVEDGDDALMIERGGGGRFGAEARQVFGGGELAGQYRLERDFAIEAGVVSAIDDAHAAAAQLGEDCIGADLRGNGRLRFEGGLPGSSAIGIGRGMVGDGECFLSVARAIGASELLNAIVIGEEFVQLRGYVGILEQEGGAVGKLASVEAFQKFSDRHFQALGVGNAGWFGHERGSLAFSVCKCNRLIEPFALPVKFTSAKNLPNLASFRIVLRMPAVPDIPSMLPVAEADAHKE